MLSLILAIALGAPAPFLRQRPEPPPMFPVGVWETRDKKCRVVFHKMDSSNGGNYEERWHGAEFEGYWYFWGDDRTKVYVVWWSKGGNFVNPPFEAQAGYASGDVTYPSWSNTTMYRRGK